MASAVDVAAPPRRIIQPKYEFDPEAVYADPQVQAWAEYYARGGTNTAGTVYFSTVPGLKSTGGDFSNTTARRQSLEVDTRYNSTFPGAENSPNEFVIKHEFVPSLPDELAVKGGEVVLVMHTFEDGWSLVRDKRGGTGMVPYEYLISKEKASIRRLPDPNSPSTQRAPESKQKKKSVLGLLEFLNITKRSRNKDPKRESSSLTYTSSLSVSTLVNSEPGTQTSSSMDKESRQMHFSTPSTDKDGLQFYTPQVLTNTSEPSPLPPSYEEVDSLAPKSCSAIRISISKEKPSASSLAGKPPSESDRTESADSATSDCKTIFQEELLGLKRLSDPHEEPQSVRADSPFFKENVTFHRTIYHNLLSFLLGEVSASATLRATLHEYLINLQSLSSVSSLVQSHDYRANLLQVASALNVSEDRRVREALQKDESEIAGLLHDVSESEASRHALLELEGEDAQKFLDVVQDVIDKGYLLNHEENVRARKLLIRLSETLDKLPSSLFVREVEGSLAFGGDVYQATYNGQRVALKRVRALQRDPGVPNIRKIFCREALQWQQLDSDFIVPFLGIDAETFPSSMCMVSPWMKHGTVLKHLADHGRAGVDKRLYEIAQGLAYLHSQKIVHGDLRGANILINDNWQACLTDFGLTVFDDATPVSFSSRNSGSVRWMAPELHVPERFGLARSCLTPETDVYAFGCVCLELYTGRPPFANVLVDSAVMFQVVHGGRPERPTGDGEMIDQLWRMVEMCWSQHFADRLKTDEVVEFTGKLSDPETTSLDLPVFSEVPKSLLPTNEDVIEDVWSEVESDALWRNSSLGKSSQIKPLYLPGNASLSKESLFIKPLPAFPRFSMGIFPSHPPSPEDEHFAYESDEGEDAPQKEVRFEEDESFTPLPSLSFQSRSRSRMTVLFDPDKFIMPIEEPEPSSLSEEFHGVLSELDSALDFSFDLGSFIGTQNSEAASESSAFDLGFDIGSLVSTQHSDATSESSGSVRFQI